MYHKKVDAVVEKTSSLTVSHFKRKSLPLSDWMTTFAKYLAYILSGVLFVLSVLLIVKNIILAPAKITGEINIISTSPVGVEESLDATSAIVPRIAVYYHGIRLGEYQGDNNTVAEVLSSYNIELSETDVTNHSLESIVSYGMELKVDDVTYKEETTDETIKYKVIETQSQTVPKGTRRVVTKGVNGVVQQVVSTKYVNGEATDDVTEFERRVEPVNEEVLVGVGGVFTAPDGKEYNYSYYLDVTATAYTHTGDPTYMGTVAEVGVIAVDPRNIDLGSKVYVIGNYGDYGVCRAEDIGGGIKGLRIDVFLDTEEECVVFGRRKMRVYILE